MTNIEIVSLAASILVFVSYLFSDQIKLRVINLVASIFFIIYGSLLLVETRGEAGYSIIGLNTGTAIMHIVYIIKMYKDKKK